MGHYIHVVNINSQRCACPDVYRYLGDFAEYAEQRPEMCLKGSSKIAAFVGAGSASNIKKI